MRLVTEPKAILALGIIAAFVATDARPSGFDNPWQRPALMEPTNCPANAWWVGSNFIADMKGCGQEADWDRHVSSKPSNRSEQVTIPVSPPFKPSVVSVPKPGRCTNSNNWPCNETDPSVYLNDSDEREYD